MIILPIKSDYCPDNEYYFLTPEGVYRFRDGVACLLDSNEPS